MDNIKKLLVSILFLILFPSFLLAGTSKKPLLREYRVEGIAVVEERNNDKARVEAMADAFKNAVRLAANVTLERDPSPEERREIEETIIRYSKRYVEGYRMLNEIFDDEYCSVNMSVTLFQDLLNKELSNIGLKPDFSESPLVLVLVEEKILPIYSRDNFMSLFSISEETIVKNLAKKGWNVTGRKGITQLHMQKKIGEGVDGNIGALVSIGKELGAAIVVAGSASIDPNSNGKSKLSIRIVSVNSHKVLGKNTLTDQSTAKDPLLAKTKALKKVSAQASRFVSEILKKEIGVRKREKRQPIAVPIQAK